MSNRTPHENMMITLAMMENRKMDKQKGEKEANAYISDNIYKVQRRVNHIRHH